MGASESTDDSSSRAGLVFHDVSESELKPGDHIYVYRWMMYSHHGIYVGNGKVIHFSGKDDSIFEGKSSAMVKKTSLSDFCKGSEIRLAAYDCWRMTKIMKRAATCFVEKSRPAEQVIATAYKYLNNPETWPKYDVDENNCADFAYFCKTGKHLDFGGISRIRFLFPGSGYFFDTVHAATAD